MRPPSGGCEDERAYTLRVRKMRTMTTIMRIAASAITTQTQEGVPAGSGKLMTVSGMVGGGVGCIIVRKVET